VPPEDISELRRVLGLFVISRKYLKDYAIITKPSTDLLRGKQPVFKWTDVQQTAYETIRDALLASIHLAAPNFELPFHLQTDASEDGKGGLLYQLPACPIPDQFPYCKNKHAPDLMAVIAHWSKAWTDALRLRPPFYLKADSLLWNTDQCKFYTLSSPFPLYTYSDHLPLAWMGSPRKGPSPNSWSSTYRSSRRCINTFKVTLTPWPMPQAGTLSLDRSDLLLADLPIRFKRCCPGCLTHYVQLGSYTFTQERTRPI
jgi:hypothetical protein